MKSSKGLIWKIIGFIISTLIVMGLYYLVFPALTLRSAGLYFFIIFAFIIYGLFFAICAFGEDSAYEKDKKNDGKINNMISTLGFFGSCVLVCVSFLILVIGGFASSAMFNASDYTNLVTIENGDFKEDFLDITENTENIAVVDWENAKRLGDRTIGNLEHASWYEVDDEYNLITVNGRQYRISVLNYGDIFKYAKANNEEFIPGYVLVDSITKEAKFVKVEDGIKYSPNAYFSYNLERHLRKKYPTYMFEKSYFEIDDEGNPYWITAVKNPTIGLFKGNKIEKVIITNAINGESTEFVLDGVPAWVDHALSLEYLMELAENHYAYVNGYFNFSKSNVYSTSYSYRDEYNNFEGYNSIIDKNGNICFYTGLTPANSAETNVGFITVSPRTGKITQYDCSGAEESSAQHAAEGLVQNLGYYAAFPIVTNVSGEETYLMCLKDKAGLVQRFALCNLKNYSIVVEGKSLEEAINLYTKKISGNNSTSNLVEKESIISEIKFAQIDGTTYVYYKLDDEFTYKANITLNENQVFFKIGDVINIEYFENNSSIKTIEKIK